MLKLAFNSKSLKIIIYPLPEPKKLLTLRLLPDILHTGLEGKKNARRIINNVMKISLLPGSFWVLKPAIAALVM